MFAITKKKKNSAITRMADQILSLNLFPDHPSTTHNQVWKMYSQAKDNLQNGARLENLSWRMMAINSKKDTLPLSDKGVTDKIYMYF